MAGLIKELMLDYAMNRLSIDQRSDITTALQSLISAGVIPDNELKILNEYLSGYTAEEIAIEQYTTTEVIEKILGRLFIALETASGYTDEGFTERVKQMSYPKTKIKLFSSFLNIYGAQFINHEPIARGFK